MATCPNCGDFLDVSHSCRGLWRLQLWYWSRVLFGGVLVGLVAILVLVSVYGRVSGFAIGMSVLLGAVIASAVLRGPS
jgi:hypothetical protein